MRLGNVYKYVLIAITAVAISVAAVLTGCPIYRIVPLYVSDRKSTRLNSSHRT